MDIIRKYEANCRNGEEMGMDYRQKAQMYRVTDPNPYSESQSVKYMQIQITDVLFEDQVCNLVHMRDSTHIFEPQNEVKQRKAVLRPLSDLIGLIKGPVRLILQRVFDLIQLDPSLNEGAS